MGGILYPPASLVSVSPLHRLHRRRPTRPTQQPVFNLTPLRASSWRWRALLSQPDQLASVLPICTFQPGRRVPPLRTPTTTTTPPPTTKGTRHDHQPLSSHHRRRNTLVARRMDNKMEQRVIALPSIVLSLSVLALGAAISSSPPPQGALSAALAMGTGLGLGLGLNLGTLVPLLTLAWHALSLLRTLRTPDRPLSNDDDLPPRIWAPHTLALLWALATLLLLVGPGWSADTALPRAALAVLSSLETGVLALAGALLQRERAGDGDGDDERGCWEHDEGDDEEDIKLGDI